MMSFVVALHVTVCVVLITIILIQRGRGGGFIEGFSGIESMFGTKTSVILSRLTSVLAVTFFFTCLALAFLSLGESKSLMRRARPKAAATQQQTNTAAPAVKVDAQKETAQQPAAAVQAQPQPAGVPTNQTAK